LRTASAPNRRAIICLLHLIVQGETRQEVSVLRLFLNHA
jgi:hypothetical protein